MDLVHFCTEATTDIDGLYESYNMLNQYHSFEILHIEYTLVYKDRAILSGTMWCEDGPDPHWELSSCIDVKYKILEPFHLNIK